MKSLLFIFIFYLTAFGFEFKKNQKNLVIEVRGDVKHKFFDQFSLDAKIKNKKDINLELYADTEMNHIIETFEKKPTYTVVSITSNGKIYERRQLEFVIACELFSHGCKNADKKYDDKFFEIYMKYSSGIKKIQLYKNDILLAETEVKLLEEKK